MSERKSKNGPKLILQQQNKQSNNIFNVEFLIKPFCRPAKIFIFRVKNLKKIKSRERWFGDAEI